MLSNINACEKVVLLQTDPGCTRNAWPSVYGRWRDHATLNCPHRSNRVFYIKATIMHVPHLWPFTHHRSRALSGYFVAGSNRILNVVCIWSVHVGSIYVKLLLGDIQLNMQQDRRVWLEKSSGTGNHLLPQKSNLKRFICRALTGVTSASVTKVKIIGPWEILTKFYLTNFQVHFSDWWLGHLSWKFFQMNVFGPHWW